MPQDKIEICMELREPRASQPRERIFSHCSTDDSRGSLVSEGPLIIKS